MSGPTIEHCGRTVAGSVVAFDIRWSGSLPAGTVRWSTVVSSPDSPETVELVHEQGPSGAEQYVAGAEGEQSVDVDADVSDGEITARFPANVVGIAAEWPVWTAVLSVDGSELSRLVVPVS